MSKILEQSYEVEVPFIAGLDGKKGNSCKLGLPKLEPINIATDTRSRVVAQIAICLISFERNGIFNDCKEISLPEKITIVSNWSYLDIKEVSKSLPKLLAEYYLNSNK